MASGCYEVGEYWIRSFDHDMTAYVTMHITKEFTLRLRLARWLVKLTGWVLDCNVEFKVAA